MIKWFRTNRSLKKENQKLKDHIKVMQEWIVGQNRKEMTYKRQISDLKKLLDIAENTKRY
jgi:uncharacterized protein YlxW (UPF0749 family)